MTGVYETIKQINKQKEDANEVLSSATFNEVMGEVVAQVKSDINQMVSENKIAYNRTLKSFSFKATDDIFLLTNK